MARLIIVALLVLWWMLTAPTAHADLGGQAFAPGLCDYPATGYSHLVGAIAQEMEWVCDFPVEINGSHHHCEWGGGIIQAGVGVSFMMFNAGANGPVGALFGSCSWRCPDMTLAAPPNPPGAWKNFIRPSKCVTVGPNPDLPPPTPCDVAAQGLPPAPEGRACSTNPGEPHEEAPALPPAPIPNPAVTNPIAPNPDQNVNSQDHPRED